MRFHWCHLVAQIQKKVKRFAPLPLYLWEKLGRCLQYHHIRMLVNPFFLYTGMLNNAKYAPTMIVLPNSRPSLIFPYAVHLSLPFFNLMNCCTGLVEKLSQSTKNIGIFCLQRKEQGLSMLDASVNINAILLFSLAAACLVWMGPSLATGANIVTSVPTTLLTAPLWKDVSKCLRWAESYETYLCNVIMWLLSSPVCSFTYHTL